MKILYNLQSLYDCIGETVYDVGSKKVDVVIYIKNEEYGEVKLVIPIEDDGENYDETGQDFTEEYYIESIDAALSAGNYNAYYSSPSGVSISYDSRLLYVDYEEE